MGKALHWREHCPPSGGGKWDLDSALVGSNRQYVLVRLQPAAPSCNSGKEASFSGGLWNMNGLKEHHVILLVSDTCAVFHQGPSGNFIVANQILCKWISFPLSKGQLYHFPSLMPWDGEDSSSPDFLLKRTQRHLFGRSTLRSQFGWRVISQGRGLEKFYSKSPKKIIVKLYFSLHFFFFFQVDNVNSFKWQV